MWKIDKFKVLTGSNLTVRFSNVPCVAQIHCQSEKINDLPDDVYSRYSCYISFVDGVPPANVCYYADYTNVPNSPLEGAYASHLTLS